MLVLMPLYHIITNPTQFTKKHVSEVVSNGSKISDSSPGNSKFVFYLLQYTAHSALVNARSSNAQHFTACQYRACRDIMDPLGSTRIW